MTAIFSSNLKERVKVTRLMLILGLLILVADQLTKFMTYQWIPHIDPHISHYPYGGISIFENFLGIDFSLNYTTNKGAAWGVLWDYQLSLITLRIGFILAIMSYLLFFNRHASWQIPLTLILAGAMGNVLDFFVYGYVVDMLHFVLWGYDFPIFNLADSAISLGIGALFFLSWLES